MVEEAREKPADQDVYSPRNNFLCDKILLLPFDSETQRREAERDFNEATRQIMDAAEKRVDKGKINCV